jgi:hypothetical protein
MGVPLQVEDLLFNIDIKKQRKRGCFACGEKGHFRDNCPSMAEPKKALYNKKVKAKQIQPPQDNTTAGVNKPMEGETVICRLCHKEGHKSFQCKVMARDKQKQKLKQKPSSKISNTYIKKVDKKAATPYLIKKQKNGKVIAIKSNKQRKGGQMHLGAKGNNFNHEKHQEDLDPEREVSGPKNLREIWRLGKVGMYIMGYIILDQVIAM